MAHLALLIDDDPARRDAFVRRVRRLLADLPCATIADAALGPMACVWAHGPRAPVSVHHTHDGLAVLLGYGVDDDGRWITASDLPERWLGDGPDRGVFDGYHVGVAFDPVRGLAAAVDPLGLFPLHYGAVGGDAVIVTTTPEAFACHDAFTERVDREALAGILLVNGPLDDRPLLAGVRRLPRGHRISWRRDRGLAARCVHEVVGQPPPAGESAEDARRRIDTEVMRAVRRHLPPRDRAAMLLSGGLDSRLVAGFLADLGAAPRAVILGMPQDYEVIAGTAVADRLGMPATVVSTDSCIEDFPALVREVARFGHLNAAPGGDDFATGLAMAGTGEPFFWSGMVLDWVFEPISENDGRDPATGAWSFDLLLGCMNRLGVPARDLPALLGRDGEQLVAAVTTRLHDRCLAGPGEPAPRAALLRWDQRVRNHVATALHQTTFVSWPLVPATDRRLFAAIFGLPVGVYTKRRLEQAVLAARRPDLAAVPLDTNSFRFDPIRDRAGPARVIARLVSAARKRVRAWSWRVRGFDPRRYERLYNVAHPRWVAVRRAAEPLRERLHEHLDAASLARVLPGPDVRVRHARPVLDGGAIRLLVALALWTDRPAIGRL